MRKPLFLLMLCASVASAAEDPQTLTARSQTKARKVIDSAVAAIGGREALQGIETLKLQLQGETWPRLQMPTPRPPFEPGQFQESLVLGFEGQPVCLSSSASVVRGLTATTRSSSKEVKAPHTTTARGR